MRDETKNLLAKAQGYLNERKWNDAGKCFVEAASSVVDKREGVEFLRKAAQACDKWGVPEDAIRCYLEASKFLEKTEKAECLMACFTVYVSNMARYEYDCGFEWRGAMDGSHDADHDFYQREIKKFQSEAEQVLRKALSIEGADKNKIIKQAKGECTKMKREGGWGESACWNIITNVTKGGGD
jgi:hypothetical protein